MPRRPRIQSQTGCYHFITRGISQKDLFHKKADYDFYLSLSAEHKDYLKIDIYHYCLMTNHTHFLIKTPDLSALSPFGHFIQRRYAYYYCKAYGWAGQVFQGRYKSLPVECDSYLLECGRYIERNPIRAGLVKKPEEYTLSSYAFYAHGAVNSILTPSPAFFGLSQGEEQRIKFYRDYVNEYRPQEEYAPNPFINA